MINNKGNCHIFLHCTNYAFLSSLRMFRCLKLNPHFKIPLLTVIIYHTWNLKIKINALNFIYASPDNSAAYYITDATIHTAVDIVDYLSLTALRFRLISMGVCRKFIRYLLIPLQTTIICHIYVVEI